MTKAVVIGRENSTLIHKQIKVCEYIGTCEQSTDIVSCYSEVDVITCPSRNTEVLREGVAG